MYEALIQLFPLILITLPLAFASAWLAPKFGGRRWLWVTLSLIPIVNIVTMYLLPLRIAGCVLDRLAKLEARSGG